MKKTDDVAPDETITTEEQESAPSEQDQQEQPTIMRVIETPMSDEERIAVGVELAELHATIEKLEDEKKAIMSRFKKNIDVKIADAHLLGQKFLAAVNTSERECPVEYNWENNIKLVKHPDSGETLQEDVISDAERQKHMPGFENQVEDDGAEGELMPCATDACEDELDGNGTKPDGDV